MKYPTPKELFHRDNQTVQWWQSVVDDPRFQHLRLLAELHAVRQLPDGYNTNTMLANDAMRQGIRLGIESLTQFADRITKERTLQLPATLHAPERPVPTLEK